MAEFPISTVAMYRVQTEWSIPASYINAALKNSDRQKLFFLNNIKSILHTCVKYCITENIFLLCGIWNSRNSEKTGSRSLLLLDHLLFHFCNEINSTCICNTVASIVIKITKSQHANEAISQKLCRPLALTQNGKR